MPNNPMTSIGFLYDVMLEQRHHTAKPTFLVVISIVQTTTKDAGYFKDDSRYAKLHGDGIATWDFPTPTENLQSSQEPRDATRHDADISTPCLAR
jgi:hypothetical protein